MAMSLLILNSTHMLVFILNPISFIAARPYWEGSSPLIPVVWLETLSHVYLFNKALCSRHLACYQWRYIGEQKKQHSCPHEAHRTVGDEAEIITEM